MSAPRRTPHVAEVLADLTAHTGTEPGEALEGRLDALAALADRPAPAPGEELAALLAGAVPLSTQRHRRTRRAAITTAAVVLAIGAGTGAAAANALPAPVQRVVAVFSEHFLPFQVPRPPRPVRQAPARPTSPTGTAVDPTPAGTSSPPVGDDLSGQDGDHRVGAPGERSGGRHAGPGKDHGVGPSAAPLPLTPAETGLPVPEPTTTASPGATDPSAGPTDAASADPSTEPGDGPSDGAETPDGPGRVQNPGEGPDGKPASPGPTTGASPTAVPSDGATAPSWATTPPAPTS